MLKRIPKFILTGLSGTLVDTAILWLLTSYLFSGYVLTFIVAPMISFEFAMLNNYVVSYFWIWHDRVRKRWRDFLKRLPTYNLTTLFSFGVKMAFLLLFERLLHLDVVLCNLLALMISGIVNFAFGEKLIFKKRRKKHRSTEGQTAE